jgi:carboxyl-terminal processing protease
MVRLTTAHYYTPSGRCIQKPYTNGVKEYRKDYVNRMTSGEMFSEDSIVFDESLKHKTLVNGRNVFGGGGVMPDIFIPMDTSAHYGYINRLRRNNIIYNYVLDYVDSHRDELKSKYSEFEKFNEKFSVTIDMIDEIVAIGEKEGIEKNTESLAFAGENMKKEIKALVARDLYSRNDFFKVLYSDDEAILKALEVIENQTKYDNLLVSND